MGEWKFIFSSRYIFRNDERKYLYLEEYYDKRKKIYDNSNIGNLYIKNIWLYKNFFIMQFIIHNFIQIT